ncbi:GNAT family N-acetyltransferase [Eubacterium sp. 1001713B170207_170306_E7]|uniref:GNAT family N-acetyltransferase n=1 Tax=Eubacterium sp. 1001713B170207_170306_E7 TaxID=2787097 RepID=UPI00189772C7|nr:GNAT family N-acetyltransferase [Eubacterium sp. 1001713B170207_170306_E7]
MESLTLIPPTKANKTAILAFKNEFFQAGEKVINGSALLNQMDYEEWLENIRRNRDFQTVREDWVVSSTFLAVREQDQWIVGIVDLRHSLGQSFLAEYGGHIGYAVRPSERWKGYAVQVLSLALEAAQELGLEAVMLGCYADNVGSIKTMLKCGGVLKEEKPYIDGKPICIYWITIREGPVRRLIQKDMNRAADIVNHCWKTTYAGYVDPVQLGEVWCGKRREAIRDEFQTNRLENFVFDENGVKAILSCGKSEDADKPEAFELWRIYVDPAFQAQGIGSKLLAFGEALAGQRHYSEMFIWTFEKNEKACMFYKKHGYKPDITQHLGENFNAEGLRFIKSL